MALLYFCAIIAQICVLRNCLLCHKIKNGVSKRKQRRVVRAFVFLLLNQVSHAVSFGIEIVLIIHMRRNGNGYMLHNIQTVSGKPLNLKGIVG